MLWVSGYLSWFHRIYDTSAVTTVSSNLFLEQNSEIQVELISAIESSVSSVTDPAPSDSVSEKVAAVQESVPAATVNQPDETPSSTPPTEPAEPTPKQLDPVVSSTKVASEATPDSTRQTDKVPHKEPVKPRPTVSTPARKQSSSVRGNQREEKSGTTDGQEGGGAASGQGAGKFVMGSRQFPKPPYPSQARMREMQGVVSLSITVSNGIIQGVRIVASSGYALLDQTCVPWIQSNWHFPSNYTGTVTAPIRFNLKD